MYRVARWLSPKYRTLAVPVAQNIELFTRALSNIMPTIIFIPDKKPKYRTVQLNTGHLATLSMLSECFIKLNYDRTVSDYMYFVCNMVRILSVETIGSCPDGRMVLLVGKKICSRLVGKTRITSLVDVYRSLSGGGFTAHHLDNVRQSGDVVNILNICRKEVCMLSLLKYRGRHPSPKPMMHIAYSPLFRHNL